jgi:hypothetical protein
VDSAVLGGRIGVGFGRRIGAGSGRIGCQSAQRLLPPFTIRQRDIGPSYPRVLPRA